MNKFSFLLGASIAILSGCHLLNNKQHIEANTSDVVLVPEENKIRPFTKESLSALLIAEFAERRGQFGLALDNYITQAKKTQDPKVIERAYQMAGYLDNQNERLNMSLLWVRATPKKIEANRAAAIELAKSGRIKDATPYFEKVLTQTKQLDFLTLENSSLTAAARQDIINSMDQLLISRPNDAQLLYTKATLLTENGEGELALSTLLKLPANQQQNNNVILLKVYLLQSLDKPDEAITLLNKKIKNYPNNKALRLSFAHRLISQGKLPEAKQQFLDLNKQYPNDEEVRFALALICLETQAWDEAISYLRIMLDNGVDPDTMHFYLATAYYEKGDQEQAFTNYQQVTSGENHLAAVANTAKILFEQNKIKEAQQILAKNRLNQPELAIPLYLFEVEELQKINKLPQAWQIINQAIKTDPTNTNLLYSRALLAEQSNNIIQSEKDLRYILKLQPNNDTAINALGYILTNKTTRYKEALKLIQQALTLNPNNPATLDSMGWIKYKLGDLTQAQQYLQKAYDNYPEPEVAAHLGEVLWKQNNHQQAKVIWAKALENNPTNKYLLQTIKRLTGSEEL